MNAKELNFNQLESVTGGTGTSSQSQAYVKAIVLAYKEQAFTREQFINEMKAAGTEEAIMQIYLDCWDSL